MSNGRIKSRARNPDFLLPAVLILAGILAYSNSLHVPFVYDDFGSIVDNPTIRFPWSLRRLLSPPRWGVTVQGRPIVNLSMAVNFALNGLNVTGYHIFNLAVHLLNALLLFGIVRRTLEQIETRKRTDQLPSFQFPVSSLLALSTALLWLLHPLHTESVTYIVQRAESLMALFYLLTLYCAARAAETGNWKPETGRKEARAGFSCPRVSSFKFQVSASSLWSAAAVLACALGMATKEVMVTAPLMALAYDRCFLSSSWREVWRRRWRLHGALLATWSILILLLGTQSEGRQRETGFAGSVSPWHYLLTQAGAMLHYLKLAVWPRGLCFDHQDWPLVRGLADAGPSLAVMGALVVLAGIAVMRAPKLGFAALFFFAVLAPTSSFMPIVDLVEEHRTYLPLAALVTLVVVGLWAALVSRNWKLETRNSSDAQHATPFSFAGFQFPVSSFQFLVILLALTLGTLTFRRNRDYRSELTLWTDTLEKRPGNARAAMNCGAALLSADAPVEALTRLNEAIRLNPNDPMAFNNRGLAHHRLGNYEQALRDLSHAVQLGGANQVRAYNNRALTFIQLGRVDSALQDLSSAIGILPSYERPYYNRGNLFLRLGRLEEGLRDLTRAMQLAPENAAAYVDRGNLYARLGQHPQAIADFSRAIRLKPREAISYYNRANSEARMGKIREALEDLTRAVDLDPGMGEAYNNRASLWYQMGDLAAALRDIAACRSLGYIPNSNLVQMIEQAWRETVAEQLAPPPANP